MIFSELQLKIQNAKELDFGTIFNDSIELFKKVWVQGLVMLLLTLVLMIPFYVLMYVPLIAMGIFNPERMEQGMAPEEVFAFIIPFYLLMLVFSFFAVIIAFGMKAGFYRICKTKDFNEATSDDYFYFFKRPYLGKTIKMAAATTGISFLAMLLCVFPMFYVIIPVALMNVIYAFNPDLSVSNIIKAGFDLGNKKWFITFGLIVVAGALAQLVGLVMCFVGIFITASFAYLPPYFLYKEIIGFDDKDDIMKIGNE